MVGWVYLRKTVLKRLIFAAVLLFDAIAATTAKKELIEDAFGRQARWSH
jgi:(p)ppGpp synthase/HD superfamily hydrolase